MTLPTLVVTRPERDGLRFVRAVEAALGQAVPHVIAPLLEIVPLSPALPPAAGLVLTSRHGVDAAQRLGLLREGTAFCVGQATAEAARQIGWDARFAGGTAEALVTGLLQERPEGPLLHLHGRHTRGDVAKRLTSGGVPTESRAVYDQVARPLSGEAIAVLAADTPAAAAVFSPRSARLLADALPQGAAPTILAISPAAATIFETTALPVRVAARPDMAAMTDLTVRHLGNVD